MAVNTDNSLFDEVDGLLKEIQEFKGNLNVGEMASGEKKSAKEEDDLLHLTETRLAENSKTQNGRVKLRVSEDKMNLYMSYFPAMDGGEDLCRSLITEALEEEGICHFVHLNWNEIERSIRIVNSTGRPIFDEEIGFGKPPVDRIPQQILISDEIFNQEQEAEESGKVDLKNYSQFIMVDQGQTIGNIIEEKAGFNGFDVYGNEIHHGTQKIETWKLGKNISIEGKTVISTMAGSLKAKKNQIEIEEILNIPGNVDYSTGNLSFKGDIFIRGYVQEGFTVKSMGNVTCKDNIYGANIQCHKNLTVHKGILGTQKGTIYCGAQLKAKFIENAVVSSIGDVYIQTGILHATVFSSGMIKTGPRGIVVGSQIYAQNGISVTQLGNKSGTTVEIYAGIDFILQKKLEKIQTMQIELTGQENQLKERILQCGEQKKKIDLAKELTKIKEYKTRVLKTSIGLLDQLDQNEGAKVVVNGRIYPGAYIEICHVAYVVKTEMHRQIFYLNKESGRIEAKGIR